MKTTSNRTERSGNGAQRTFDRRGARAMRLAARPPARFSSLRAINTGQDGAADCVGRNQQTLLLYPCTTSNT